MTNPECCTKKFVCNSGIKIRPVCVAELSESRSRSRTEGLVGVGHQRGGGQFACAGVRGRGPLSQCAVRSGEAHTATLDRLFESCPGPVRRLSRCPACTSYVCAARASQLAARAPGALRVACPRAPSLPSLHRLTASRAR